MSTINRSPKGDMAQLVGKSLDRYQIIGLQGQGGMGAVFKAQDLTLQRVVALKVMHPQFAAQPDFQARFLQEARTAAHLDHPGIVKVFDFGKSDSLLYIVMEFLPGDDLRHLLQDLKATSKWIVLSEAVQLVRQVCLAIEYAHQQGVLHRDIKPDNIMLKPEPNEGLPYRPVLTDLGLAKLLEGGMSTHAGVSMGTPAYMSPEQAQGQETDARSDVYSLGILLYELAVGQLPFPIKTITEAIRYHTKEPPPPPRTRRPDLPVPVEKAILRALEKEPAARFANTQTMADALASIVQATPTLDAPKTALGAAVSLMTQHQASVVRVRGESVLQEFPSAPSALTQDRISILAPDHSIRTVDLNPNGMTLGRGSDNDVVLDYQNVSRHHVRITFDSGKYQVTDLNSTNGTYLATFKLLPGIPEDWPPDKPLRVGDCYVRMERKASGAPVSGVAGVGGTMMDPSRIQSSPGAGRVGVFCEARELTVAPGGSVSLPLTILNQGAVVDAFKISTDGVPAAWVTVPSALVRLLPGMSQDVTLVIQPPRSSQSKAGAHPFALKVASQEMPDQIAQLQLPLIVQPFHQFSTRVAPEKIKTGKPARVVIENQGNTAEAFDLKWQDQADELTFAPAQARLDVVAGREAALAFRAAPKQRRWLGREKHHAFSVLITPVGGEPRTQTSQAVSAGLIPLWVPALLMTACLALSALAYAFFARPPVIQRFTYTPATPMPGQSVVVFWEVTNAQRIDFTPPILGVDPYSGSYSFSDPLLIPKGLTIIASNPFGSVSQRLDVPFATATPAPTQDPGAPVIEIWTVSSKEIVEGQTVTLRWQVKNADTVTITPFGTQNVSGEQTDTPRQTRMYTLRAANKSKSVEQTIEVFVRPPTLTPDFPATQFAQQATAAAQQTAAALIGANATATASANATATAVARQATQTAAAVAATQTAFARQAAQAAETLLAGGNATIAAIARQATQTASAQQTAARATAIAQQTQAALGATQTAAARGQFFSEPKWNGYRLDWCYTAGAQCGVRAATEWCKRQGFAGATDFQDDPDVGKKNIRTIVLSNGGICTSTVCDSFKSITCSVWAVPAPVQQTFSSPTEDGVRVDLCYSNGTGCGIEAATQWCKRRQFTGAIDYVEDFDVGKNGILTKVLSTGMICNGSWCDSFKTITCVK